MTFSESVKTTLSKYADFSGRASRPEYWWFVLFNILISIVANIVDYGIGVQLLAFVVGLGLLLPGLGVSVRRLHDLDRSGWWLLIGLIPIVGFIVLIVWFATAGLPGDNRFGPAPLA